MLTLLTPMPLDEGMDNDLDEAIDIDPGTDGPDGSSSNSNALDESINLNALEESIEDGSNAPDQADGAEMSSWPTMEQCFQQMKEQGLRQMNEHGHQPKKGPSLPEPHRYNLQPGRV